MMNRTRSKTTPEKDLEYYDTLKYPIEIVEDDGAYVASIVELPGCVSYGETLEEAVQNLNATKRLWIAGRLESGRDVPEPAEVDEFSGKFVLRIPRTLHRSLDREAKREGVSLNQYIAHLLSERHKEQHLQKLVESFNPVVCSGSSTCPVAHGMRMHQEYSVSFHQDVKPAYEQWEGFMGSGYGSHSKSRQSVGKTGRIYTCVEARQ